MKLYLLLLALLLCHSSFSQLLHAPITHEQQPAKNFLATSLRGSLPHAQINNDGNVDYYGIFLVGSNKNPLKLLIDTGSNRLWVRGSKYNCLQSSTCTPFPNVSASTLFVDGTGYAGYMINDQIQFGDVTLTHFNMSWALPKNGAPYTGVSNDTSGGGGTCGLSPLLGQTPFPVAAYQAGLTGSSSFSIYLGINSKSAILPTGQITFGGYDPTIASNFTFLPMTPNADQWRTTFQGLGLGGTTVNVNFTDTITVLFDTGNSDFLVPPKLKTAIADKLNSLLNAGCFTTSTGSHHCNCSIQGSVPDMIFYLGGKTTGFSIPGEAYFKKSGDFCYIALGSGGSTSMNLGDGFLKYYYMMFNYDNQTIGIAKPNPNLPTPISTS